MNTKNTPTLSRRGALKHLVAGSAVMVAPGVVAAKTAPPSRLRFYHTHTGEHLDALYIDRGEYVSDALSAISHLLRDHRSGEAAVMDPKLLDFLQQVQSRVDSDGVFEIISGYRSSATNQLLRKRGGGVAKRSLHMQGRAIDVRLRGVKTADLRKAALSLKRGGVGYYARSDFVHLDTGRVRFW